MNMSGIKVAVKFELLKSENKRCLVVVLHLMLQFLVVLLIG